MDTHQHNQTHLSKLALERSCRSNSFTDDFCAVLRDAATAFADINMRLLASTRL
eukprot:COSAG02_NODE_17505_length_999_cov_0.822222_2_plen_53_part_01